MTKVSITGWRSLLLWSLIFASVSFAFLSVFSIGIYIAPIAFFFVLIAALLTRSGPEAPLGGLFIGAGLMCLLIAFLDPVNETWLIAGLLLVAAGIAGYFLIKALKANIGH